MGGALDLKTEAKTASSQSGSNAFNPLALGLGSIAVGVVVGLIVPITEFERENLGPVGGRLTQRARDSATDLVARGKSAIIDAVSATLKAPTNNS